MRFLAIDYGEVRTGLAVCDADETMAFPLNILRGQHDLAQRIADVIAAERIDAVVMGLPLNMDGSEGPQAKRAKTFADRLLGCVEVPVFFQDERLSSFEARDKLRIAGWSRNKTRDRLDAVAAAEILQAFLESRKQA